MRTRVLEVLASLKRAGAEHVAVSVACGLDRARFEPALVSLMPPSPGDLEGVLRECGVPVRRLGKHPGLDARMWPRLASAIREFQPDIIHTHSYILRYVFPAWLARRSGVIVHTVHNVAGREVDAIGRFIHRVAFQAGVKPVAISEEVAKSFRQVYGFNPAATIPNGASTSNGFRPCARKAWRDARGFNDRDLLIVSVARLEPQKNPLGLLDAFATALPSLPGAQLVMAGEGSLMESVRAAAERLGIAKRVHLIGLCQDIPELLSAADLFVLASNWEGASVAIIEAMAARLPVVATAVGGVPELVEHEVTGLLVPAGDPGALGAAFVSLADDPARRGRMAEAALARAARFDTKGMVEAYARFFEQARRRPA